MNPDHNIWSSSPLTCFSRCAMCLRRLPMVLSRAVTSEVSRSSLRACSSTMDYTRPHPTLRPLPSCWGSRFTGSSHLDGVGVEPSLTPWPRLRQALHLQEDPVAAALRGSLLPVQILQTLLQVSGGPPQPVPPGAHYMKVLPHQQSKNMTSLLLFEEEEGEEGEEREEG